MKPKTSTHFQQAFAQRLAVALDQRGFPKQGRVARLSELMGVTPSAASAWLKGTLPSVETMPRLCEELGTSLAFLLAGKTSEEPQLDLSRLTRAVRVINHVARREGVLDLGDTKLSQLYAFAYERLKEGAIPEREVRAAIALASSPVESEWMVAGSSVSLCQSHLSHAEVRP